MTTRISIGYRRINKGALHVRDERQTRELRKNLQALNKRHTMLLEDFNKMSHERIAEDFAVVFKISQILVPVDTGALKESGFYKIEPLKRVGGMQTVVRMGYGLRNKPFYAVKVHEDLAVYHAPPTQAKFLEYPLRSIQQNVVDAITRTLRERTRDLKHIPKRRLKVYKSSHTGLL